MRYTYACDNGECGLLRDLKMKEIKENDIEAGESVPFLLSTSERSSHAAPMLGRKFGFWTVVAEAPNSHSYCRRWICKCICGKTYPVMGMALRRGSSKGCRSCRQMARWGNRSLIGQVRGKWTVLAESKNKRPGVKLWICRCECGFEREVPGCTLQAKNVGGCRKCKAENMKKLCKRSMWSRIEQMALDRGYEFSIEKEETFLLLEKQEFKCALTGQPIILAKGVLAYMHGESTASLDRIHNEKGYVKGNIWWVHKNVNRMKWVLPLAEFITICHQVANLHPLPESKEK